MGGFTTDQLFYLGLMVVALGATTTIVMDITKKQGNNPNLKNVAKYSRKFSFYYDNFFFRKTFRRIFEQLSSLQLYSLMELRIVTVKAFEKITLICLAIIVFGLVIIGDPITFAILSLFVVIVRDVFIQKKVDDSQRDMTVALSKALASLSDNYTKYGEIPEAVRVAERDPILDQAFENIYSILTSDRSEDQLNEYYQTQYFTKLKTLASVCFLLDKYGDSDEDSGEMAKFKQAVMFIKDEVDLEVRQMTKKKLLFGKLEFLPVIPILAIGIVQKFFIGIIPGTSLLYNGIYGFLIRIILVGLSTYGYYFIANVSRTSYIRKYDRFESIDWLLERQVFSDFINTLTPKTFKARCKYDEILKGCLSSQDVQYIYACKVIYSTLAFILSTLATIIIIAGSRSYIYNSIEMMSFTQSVHYTTEQEFAMRAYDKGVCKQPECPSDDVIAENVEYILPLADETEIADQVSRIKTKYTNYNNLIYHWWLILIVIGITIGFWYIPEQTLKQRKKIVMEDAKEDVLQIQTLISILSSTTLDTQEVLYWLCKNSVIHKDHLNFAFQEYPSDPEMSIARLKRNSAIPEFHQLCDKLALTCFNITLKEAFSDLVPERNHMMKIREMEADNKLQAKRSEASPLSQLPLYVLIFGMIVAPMLILGMSQFKEIMGNMQF